MVPRWMFVRPSGGLSVDDTPLSWRVFKIYPPCLTHINKDNRATHSEDFSPEGHSQVGQNGGKVAFWYILESFAIFIHPTRTMGLQTVETSALMDTVKWVKIEAEAVT